MKEYLVFSIKFTNYMKSNVLIVDDEEHLLSTLVLNFEIDGYTVFSAKNGIEAIHLFQSQKIDLVILDIMMPYINGVEVCRVIRETNKNIPILFLTANNSSADKIEGLRSGADDYLTKPFNLEELILRVENLLRRTKGNLLDTSFQIPKIYYFGEFEINFSTYEIIGVNGQNRLLNKKEILLLKLLIERKNEVVSRDEIMEKIWGEEVTSTTRTIDNYILAIRKYFEQDPKNPIYFHTVRGIGYKYSEK